MVSERRQLAKRPSFQKQTLAELELSSAIPSFREKKFKKKAASPKHTRRGDNLALAKKKTAPLDSTLEYRKRVPGSKESLSSSLKPARSVDVRSHSNPANKHSCHSNKQPNNPHSPRAFSLFTLQEYLHERCHIDGATSPTAHTDLKHYKECMSMESSHGLHVSADKEMDAVPLRHAHLQHTYTRKSRKKMTLSYYAKSFGSMCECNGAGCKHDFLEGLHCTEYSTGEEHVDDINDEKNEALSIKGYHGCVPWHNLSSVTPKCNKKKMIMDIAGKSFACGGFQVSKRHNRLRMSGRTREVCMRRSRRKPQCDSLSSNFGSESAPLLSDSEAHETFLRSQCYPGCTSLPRLMRRKLQLADHADMVDSLHSLNFGENGLAKERMRRSKTHTNHRKGPKSRAGKDGIDCSCELSSSHGCRKNSHGHSNSIAIENREQHQSLSEKYRPCTFEEMVGQSMISQALSNAIHRGKIAPAYLFQGPRGTGKTCAAKIFAMSINCLFKDRSTKTTMPCRSCRHCESMFSGKSSNVRIVDANNGIGDIKSLSRFIRIMGPHTSKYKVLIIDECHMLSKEAWSLFLNIIDQSPIRVVFILITTDTEQLPRMVISKCQKFSFIKIKDADIISRLWRLCEMEGINVESNALQLIACRAYGSLFEAETTLDQLSNLGQRITSGLVREMVGLVADEKLVELLDAAMRGDSVNTVRCIRQLMEAGIEPLALTSQLATLITDLLAGHPPPLISSSSTSSAFTSHPLSKMELEKLRQALKILSEAEKQLRSCNNKTTWLTAALLQFCPPDSAFHLNDSHNHEAAQYSSMGTSLTQSPNALLDTSEKETADNPCYSITNVKPPWDISHKWQDEPREDSERCEDIEKTENLDNVDFTHIDPHSKISDYIPPVDVAIPCYGMYHRSPSVHRNHHVRVESESCLQKNSIATEIACVNYGCGNNSTQVTPSSMDGLWKQILESSILTDILSGQGKLVSLSVSEAYAIAHLEFGLLEDKKRAENAKASISEAFQMALGCPVEVQLSLMSTPGTPNRDINSSNNGFYGGTLENTQLNQRKGRRRKLRKRPSVAGCCNKGSMSANYYSKHQSWCNSSDGHQFLKNSAFSNAHHITRGSSSDESFTKWTQMYNNKLGLPTARALQKISTSSIRDESKGHVDLYEKYTQCALSGSQNGKIYVSENVDDTSQDLLYDASLRVERDSTNYSHQSLEYDELEYERRNMTPTFRTGFLCWKASTKDRHESKICLKKAREKQVTGCCAS